MKKLLFILLCAVASMSASAQDGKLTLNAGFLFPSTLNATLGYEYPLSYGNAVEVFGEAARTGTGPFPRTSGRIITGTAVFCTSTACPLQDGMLRFARPQFGAVNRKFFLGLEGGFEYSYVLRSGMEFSIIQKNNVNFLHGDTFRNGLLLGIKIPF